MKHIALRHRLYVPDEEEELEQSSDHVDHRPSFSKVESDLLREDKEPVTLSSVLLSGAAMVSYSMDVASSAALCAWLFDSGGWWWWATAGPLVASLLVVNGFSIRWYLHDAHDHKEHLLQVSAGHWAMRGLFHAVLLGPLLRYSELFLYGLHTVDRMDPKRNQYRLMFLQEDRDVSLLALVGSFIKSAPQLVLQMYILTKKTNIDLATTHVQAVNLVSSLVELSLAQSAYHRALRRSSPLKHNITRVGTFVQFFSHCCVIGSRVLALASFASVYEHWVFVFCGLHWSLMSTWLFFLKTSYCATTSGQQRPLEEFVFNIVIGVIYVFCFVNVKDEPTRWKYVTYYFIIWIENVVLTTMWFIKADPNLWFRIPLLSAVVLSLAVGLVFLGVYYQFLHPNKVWNKRQQ